VCLCVCVFAPTNTQARKHTKKANPVNATTPTGFQNPPTADQLITCCWSLNWFDCCYWIFWTAFAIAAAPNFTTLRTFVAFSHDWIYFYVKNFFSKEAAKKHFFFENPASNANFHSFPRLMLKSKSCKTASRTGS
jgi:hypothetical protein